LYPTDVPHSEKKCTPRVPHSRPAQLATLPMIEQGRQLAFLLSSLAQQVFHLPLQSIHLFRDIDSGTNWFFRLENNFHCCFRFLARIAFNTNGSLFYNVRYFEQVYWDDLQWSRANGQLSLLSSSIARRIVNFYYMVTCHELSHNIHSNRDLNFINRLEKVSVRFMDEKDAFLARFSFQ